ncbi:MAG: HlyD family efflux transporter periplasmic adaptor subunit [Tepidisphaeraceae bacterium]
MTLGFTNSQRSTKSSPAWLVPAAGVVALLTVGTIGTTWYLRQRTVDAGVATAASSVANRLIAATQEDLDATVDNGGELQAVDNIELTSRVEGRATINDIAREGAMVKAGDTVIELDSSVIRQNIDDSSIAVQSAQAAVANAKSQLKIQQSNNEAELEGANVALTLADLELKKYKEGTFPQSLDAARAKVQIATTNLAQKKDDLTQSRNLFQRGFVTAADVKTRENAVAQASVDLQAAQSDLKVLTDYQYQADIATKNNAVVQARNKLERVKTQNESLIMQRQADLASSEQTLETRQRRLEFLQQQLEACSIKAPSDGLVVYVQPDNNQGGPIQQGAEVRERQVIVRLPDTSRMKAVVRVSEGLILPIRVGQRALVRVNSSNEAVSATVTRVSLMPDSSRGWWNNSGTKEYPVDVQLDRTPEGLKPGASVTVSIFVNRVPGAISVPLPSIYSEGDKSFVFVDENGTITPREVTVGLVTKRAIQIKSGLKQDERVLQLQAGEGQALLKRAGIRVEEKPKDATPGEDPNHDPHAANPQGGPGGLGAPNGGPGMGGPGMGAANGNGPGPGMGGQGMGNGRRRGGNGNGGPGNADGTDTGTPRDNVGRSDGSTGNDGTPRPGNGRRQRGDGSVGQGSGQGNATGNDGTTRADGNGRDDASGRGGGTGGSPRPDRGSRGDGGTTTPRPAAQN